MMMRWLGPVTCFALACGAHHRVSDDPLVGIWATELVNVPGLHGEMTVTRKDARWYANVSGIDATVTSTGDSLRMVFGDGRGELRGTVGDGGRAVRGFWLQPAGGGQEPTLEGYATPLILQPSGSDVWHATVKPLEARYTLYLKIYRDAEGKLVGAFRNPENNSHGGASLFDVVQRDDKVTLTARPNQTKPEVRHEATLSRAPDRLQLAWSDLGRAIELVRKTPEQARDFFPRPPGEAPYVYTQPPVTDDGWATARASDVGLDEAALARVVQSLIDADPAARRPSLIHALLVAHQGKLVLEEYFFGFARDLPHDTRSAGKTFASVMLGAAERGGVKISADTKAYELLAGLGPFANSDPRKSQITLAHLMTHSAGLACDDYNNDSPGNENTMTGSAQKAQPNWWKYTLDLPMAHDPGTHYAYCSANMNLVGAALTIATRTWLPEWFERTVARPLQFGTYYWNLMPTNEGYLGGGARLRPRDLLKLGQAYLDGGTWHGARIVDESWVKDSTAPHIHIAPETTGLSADQFGEQYVVADDGYAWHLGAVHAGAKTYRSYAATGNGGQLLVVIPELDLTVVFTGGNYQQGGIWLHWTDDIVGKQIIPAMQH